MKNKCKKCGKKVESGNVSDMCLSCIDKVSQSLIEKMPFSFSP